MSKKYGPEPLFHLMKNRWSVQLQGKQINLGPDEAACVRLQQLVSGAVTPFPKLPYWHQRRPRLRCDRLFVGWSHEHWPGRTARWYQNNLRSFLDSLSDTATITVEALKGFHATNWIDAYPPWGRTTAAGPSPPCGGTSRGRAGRVHH